MLYKATQSQKSALFNYSVKPDSDFVKVKAGFDLVSLG